MHPTLNRPLWRMAERIWAIYRENSREEWTPCFPDFQWECCEQLRRQITRAHHRRYSGAARQLRLELIKELADVVRKCDEEQKRALKLAPTPLPTLRLLYEELLALDQEFDDVVCDLQAQSITVHTEPIVLEEVYLGRFKIVLNIRRLGSFHVYEVRALDPHPAASNEETTHPHVQGRRLCAGDGWDTIESALKQGRLSEFFLIVRQILRTYNAGSAHVSLDEWSGISCSECGYVSDESDSYCCAACYCSLCSDCSRSCEFCCDNRCHGCLETCQCCELYACQSCLQRCARCDDLTCRDCISPELICNTCLENEDGDDEPDESVTTEAEGEEWAIVPKEGAEPAVATDAAVHAHGVGQAAVSA